MGNHGFHHAGFVNVKFHHRTVVFNRPHAGHEVVRPEARHKRRCRRPDNAAVVRAQRTARHHHLKARVLIKNVRHPQAVGDDAQMIMVKQCPGNVLHGRPDSDKDGRTVGNIVRNGFGNRPFLFGKRDFTLFERRVDHAGCPARTAVMTGDQPLLAELTDIPAHGLCRHIQQLRQFINVHIAAIGNQRQQLIVTRVAGQFGKAHGLSSENHHAPHFIQKVTKKSGFDHSRVYPRARRALCISVLRRRWQNVRRLRRAISAPG